MSDDKVDAMVLSVDKENEKISLGIKQMEPDPWLTIEDKYPIGKVVTGKVRNLTAFGAFVELEEGIDGLVHISDMSWTKRIQHPSEVMKKGDKVDVKVLKIDHENRRISLGFKQLIDDPWPELAKRFAVGAECLGTITKVLDRGVVVDLGDDVEGFVPSAQLGRPRSDRPDRRLQRRRTDPVAGDRVRPEPAQGDPLGGGVLQEAGPCRIRGVPCEAPDPSIQRHGGSYAGRTEDGG